MKKTKAGRLLLFSTRATETKHGAFFFDCKTVYTRQDDRAIRVTVQPSSRIPSGRQQKSFNVEQNWQLRSEETKKKSQSLFFVETPS